VGKCRWEEELVRGTGNPQGVGEQLPVISFECETLKADNKAEHYIKQFFPSLVGLDAVGKATKSFFSQFLLPAIFLFQRNFFLPVSFWKLYSETQLQDCQEAAGSSDSTKPTTPL
jgi:hypothetical protein